MLKRSLIFTIIAAVIMVIAWRLGDSNITKLVVKDDVTEVEVEEREDDKSYVLSVSPRGDKKIVCTDDNELVLLIKNDKLDVSKTIYHDYSPLSTDPYSIYSSEKYLIQWSQNERYVFIRDSLYDIETDELIDIKSNVVFMWVGNKGLYMDNGYYYTMGFDASYSNYLAISKNINVFENGNIRTLPCEEEDEYFVLDNVHMENMFEITDDRLIINTASLKYEAEDLQEIINERYLEILKAIDVEKKAGRYGDTGSPLLSIRFCLDNIVTVKIKFAEELEYDKSYVLSVSPHGNKKIICTVNNELILHQKSSDFETSKIIYENYASLSTDPYSMYNLDKYNVQWSQNERYVFVRDSIYDIETDELTDIKSNVAFMWVGNKGLYMDNGYYYRMFLGAGYANNMAISKEISVFEEGNIRMLACAEDNRYFVLDNVHMENMFDIIDDCLVVNTASLKYEAEDLQEIINEEYSRMVKAIYEEKEIGRYEYPEAVIVNGEYYLENIRVIKIQLD